MQLRRPQLQVRTAPTGDKVLQDKAIQIKPRYDTWRLLAGTTIPSPLQFFIDPEGSGGSGFAIKTNVHTNNQLVQQLEKNVAINIHRIGVSIAPVGDARGGDAVAQLIAKIWEDTILRFSVNEVVALECLLLDFAAGDGLTGIAAMSAVSPETFVAPAPTIRGVRMLARKIPLPARSHFNLELEVNRNSDTLIAAIPDGADIGIKISLHGRTTRPLD